MSSDAIYMKGTLSFASSDAASAFIDTLSVEAEWISQHVSWFMYRPDSTTCCWTLVHGSSELFVKSWRYFLASADLMVRFRGASSSEWHVVGLLSPDAGAELGLFSGAFPTAKLTRCTVRGGYVTR